MTTKYPDTSQIVEKLPDPFQASKGNWEMQLRGSQRRTMHKRLQFCLAALTLYRDGYTGTDVADQTIKKLGEIYADENQTK